MKKSAEEGFTLLEMTIVVTIIGVLVAAVMFAQSLVVTSRLQTVITDVDSYTSAVANFKQQYNALPGDFPTATAIWGQVSAGCTTQKGTGTQTCNGNGDGMIGGVSGQEFEVFRFWQQLQNSGMLSQNMTGVNNGGGVYDSLPGSNVPKGSIKGSGLSVLWLGTIGAGNTQYFPGFYGNRLEFGYINPGYDPSGGALTADQAYAIDSKMDDGIPSTGKVRATINGATWFPTCTSSTTLYMINTTIITGAMGCPLYFVMGF